MRWAGEQLGEQPHHHLAVFQHVADAAGGAQVVFQHVPGAVAVAHQVHPGDVGVEVAVQIQPAHGHLVAIVGQHLLGGNDAGLEDALLVVEIGEEQVQRLHPLDAATFHGAPLAGRNGAGNDVEGNQSLGALLITVQGERDTRAMEQQIRLAPALGQHLLGRVRQPLGEGPVVGPTRAPRVVHLVVEPAPHSALLASSFLSTTVQGLRQRKKSRKFNPLRNDARPARTTTVHARRKPHGTFPLRGRTSTIGPLSSHPAAR